MSDQILTVILPAAKYIYPVSVISFLSIQILITYRYYTD